MCPLVTAASVSNSQGGWGTENYIIPLGAGYIEIAAVWDPEAAQSCDWGRYAHLPASLCVWFLYYTASACA